MTDHKTCEQEHAYLQGVIRRDRYRCIDCGDVWSLHRLRRWRQHHIYPRGCLISWPHMMPRCFIKADNARIRQFLKDKKDKRVSDDL